MAVIKSDSSEFHGRKSLLYIHLRTTIFLFCLRHLLSRYCVCGFLSFFYLSISLFLRLSTPSLLPSYYCLAFSWAGSSPPLNWSKSTNGSGIFTPRPSFSILCTRSFRRLLQRSHLTLECSRYRHTTTNEWARSAVMGRGSRNIWRGLLESNCDQKNMSLKHAASSWVLLEPSDRI